MNYSEWNIAIASHLFNHSKAEQEVFLFLTIDDIIQIGRSSGETGTDSLIFQEYISSLLYDDQKGGNLTPFSPIYRPLELFKKWKKLANQQEEYPYYLGFLILYILPLTSESNPSYNYNNYYGRVNDYFKRYNIHNDFHNSRITTQNFSQLDQLWEDLQEWSILKRDTELGFFELHSFNNRRWIYVGKPLSQCIFPSQSFKRLPQFYELFGIVPGEQLSQDNLRSLLIQKGEETLGLQAGAINAIKDRRNELGDSILRLVYKHYQDWQGETDYYNEDTDSTTRGITLSSLRLGADIDFVNGTADLFFRLYSPTEYPEDLEFNDKYKCTHQSHGLSKIMRIPFDEGINLMDQYNKWKAVFPRKDVRILVNGDNFHLNGWVEVPQMFPQSKMLLIANKEISSSISEWGNLMEGAEFSEINLFGIPGGLKTFLVRNPTIGHPDVPNLNFSPDKRILLLGGIKIGIRTYLPDYLPEILLENGVGNEVIYLIKDLDDERIFLERKKTERPIWILPQNIKKNTKYFIKVKGTKVTQSPGIKITTYNSTSFKYSEDDLPKRDKFGELFVGESEFESYVIGSKVIIPNDTEKRRFHLRKGMYSQFFQPFSKNPLPLSSRTPGNNIKDLLLFYLSSKKMCKVKDYRDAFDTIYYKGFNSEEIEGHLAISKLKRYSLNFLDYMGFLDFDHISKMIVVNAPQLIPIPSPSGRKALLIGGRTPELLEKLWIETEEEGLSFNYTIQDGSVDQFIIPSTITISGSCPESNQIIEEKILKVAQRCKMSYNPRDYLQFSLTEFSGTINDYQDQLIPVESFNDQGWSVKVFDPNNLKFVRVKPESLDRTYTLTEYKLNEYTYIHRLWMNNKAYIINKNWGRYLILNHFNKDAVLCEHLDSNIDLIAVPVTLPLPRLISEAMTLLSGKAPLRKRIPVNKKADWYNIYFNIPHIFAHNFFMKVGQNLIELKIRELCEIQ